MFIVYSPEGQSAVGTSHLHPALKVDPSTKVNAVPRSELEQMHMDATDAEKKHHAFNPAIKQYQHTLEGERRKHVVVHAHEIMSSPVFSIHKDMNLLEAWQFMQQKQVHHLPVLNENEELVGLCTGSCVLSRGIFSPQGSIEEIRNEQVEQVMQTEVITTHANMDIRKIAYVMSEYKVGCLPIMAEQGSVVGIVTLSDIVKRLSEEPPVELYV